MCLLWWMAQLPSLPRTPEILLCSAHLRVFFLLLLSGCNDLSEAALRASSFMTLETSKSPIWFLETPINPAWTGPILWKLLKAQFDFGSLWKPYINRLFSWAFRGFQSLIQGFQRLPKNRSYSCRASEASELLGLMKSCANRFCSSEASGSPTWLQKSPEVTHKFGSHWKSHIDRGFWRIEE